jgi:hypothetical protein
MQRDSQIPEAMDTPTEVVTEVAKDMVDMDKIRDMEIKDMDKAKDMDKIVVMVTETKEMAEVSTKDQLVELRMKRILCLLEILALT